MKLDPNKPYGLIYGNTEAMYEQNGQCFGGNGEPVELVDAPEEAAADAGASAWLHALLSGGPMVQNEVYKACERDGQVWAEVKTVPGVKRYVYRKADMWKLIPN